MRLSGQRFHKHIDILEHANDARPPVDTRIVLDNDAAGALIHLVAMNPARPSGSFLIRAITCGTVGSSDATVPAVVPESQSQPQRD